MAGVETRALKRGRVDTASTTDADPTEVEAVAKAMLAQAADAHVRAKAKLEAAEKGVASMKCELMKMPETSPLAKLRKLLKAASSKWEAAKLRYTPIVEARGNIDSAALASLARAISWMFDDSDKHVRRDAVGALGRLGQTTLALYAGDIIGMLDDPFMLVRCHAVDAIGKLEKASWACHATVRVLVGMLRDQGDCVRRRAMKALGNLDSAELTPHADAIIFGLLAADGDVMHEGMVLLCKLDKEALTPNASAMVCALTSRNSASPASPKDVKPAVLARVYAIRSLLHGHKLDIRERAMRVFFVLEEEMISFHVKGIVKMLTDSEWLVRDCAIEVIESNTNAVTAEVLSLVISAVSDMLRTGTILRHGVVSFSVTSALSCSVISALLRLKRKLAQMHWATARVYSPLVRSYGRFWYEEACKSLCAPGGKWAERDRAAFEAEFSHISQ
jgi:HEAT repeat protein